jgi:hypothetical protein
MGPRRGCWYPQWCRKTNHQNCMAKRYMISSYSEGLYHKGQQNAYVWEDIVLDIWWCFIEDCDMSSVVFAPCCVVLDVGFHTRDIWNGRCCRDVAWCMDVGSIVKNVESCHIVSVQVGFDEIWCDKIRKQSQDYSLYDTIEKGMQKPNGPLPMWCRLLGWLDA